jgi:hypothetical protein
MAKSNEVQIDLRLYFWPHYAAVARLVRYDEVPDDLLQPELDKLGEQFGRAKVHEAFVDVCEYVRDAQGQVTKTVRLRAKVRTACFSLLGPAPEDEDWFYRHPDGTPKPRPQRKRSPLLTGGQLPSRGAKKPSRGGKARKRTADRVTAEMVKNGAKSATSQPKPEAAPRLKVVPVPEPAQAESRDLRALKRQYRTLKNAYRMTAQDSPAKRAFKADVQALRRKIQELGGGTAL